MRTIVLIGLMLAVAAPTADAAITADYVEVRTGDVFTGPCFAEAEVGLRGREAILAWRVRDGRFDGVELGGLAVVAVVRADRTLGDPAGSEARVRAVVLVDERAGRDERRALVALAREASGGLVGEPAEVVPAPIAIERGTTPGEATLEAGSIANVRTRPIGPGDHFCGNERVYYPPLGSSVEAEPAFTLVHEFRGDGLGARWISNAKRSAFVGTYRR